MRILFVEDNQHLARSVVKGLREEGYTLDHAAAGDEARLLVSTRHYDMIVLDRMLPVVSGDQLLAEWRQQGLTLPILMLTALDAVRDRVTGLRAGADDYLVKPFDFEELLARLEALGRRGGGSGSVGPVLSAGDLTLDPTSRNLNCHEKMVELSGQEYRLMEFFMRHPDQVLTRTMLAYGCWQEPETITDNAVEAQVKNLRKRIAAVSDREWLQTRRGHGYVLVVNVR